MIPTVTGAHVILNTV